MKKRIGINAKTLVIAICLTAFCVGLVFAAPRREARELTTVMGTSGMTGSWYPVASTIAGAVEKHTDSRITIQASGGSTENLRLMQTGEFGMGMVNSAMMYYAYEGVEAFEGAPYKGLRNVVNLFPVVVQMLVYADSPYQTYADLKGRRVTPGSPGSGDEIAYTEIFSVYGLSRDDFDWRPLSHTERVMAFKDGVIQAVGFFTSVPASSPLEISSLRPIRVLSIADKQDEFFRQFPYYYPVTVPRNTYRGVTEDVVTVGAGTVIAADEGVSEQLVYDYLVGMFAEIEQVQAVHAMAKYIKPETATSGFGDVPVHPGAIRFYRERGMME